MTRRTNSVLIVNRVYGYCEDEFWAPLCAELAEQDRLEIVTVAHRNAGSRRQTITDKGTPVVASFVEAAHLRSGAVVFYEEDHRVVLAHVEDARVLVIAPLKDFLVNDALELGNFLGRLQWPFAHRQRAGYTEIFVPCVPQQEEEMDAALRATSFEIAWTFRDRHVDDPLPESDE
jgi:urease accessory protein UreE